MKYITSIFCTLVFGWPAFALGYIWCAVRTCFIAGMLVSDDHASDSVEKFRRNK